MAEIIFTLTHLVKMSPWPVCTSVTGFGLLSRFLFWFKYKSAVFFFVIFVILLIQMFAWWYEVVSESVGGEYSPLIVDGLKLGILLFILREVCFFAAFFWTFFHSSFTPAQEVGRVWPPFILTAFNPFHGPLLNTLILLSSGVSVTWAHHNLIGNSQWLVPWAVTIVLGLYFTLLQAIEYFISSFTMRDRVFGSTFFIATGFHGLHVLIGTLFLIVCFIRALGSSFTSWHHLGLEIAIWYWHFVDVVWLFLFSFIYWWGY